MKIIIISLAIGLTAGLFGGILGIGGGLIMIPLMVEILKMAQHKAHGTSLLALVFTGIGGAIAYASHGSVDLTAAALLALTAVLTAPLGARYCNVLTEKKLKKIFGAFLIFCAVLLFLKPYLTNFIGVIPGYAKIIVLLTTGVFTGFLSGMMGVGGGTIMIPVMVILIGFTQHVAQGTSLLVMVPTGAIGAFTHWKMGNIEKGILWGLIPGIILGTYLGGNFANIIPENTLRLIFAFIIITLGLRYFITSPPESRV
ncbi:MAG: sulfite exporter TauE/SafE family protein [Smithella sp.]